MKRILKSLTHTAIMLALIPIFRILVSINFEQFKIAYTEIFSALFTQGGPYFYGLVIAFFGLTMIQLKVNELEDLTEPANGDGTSKQ